MNERIKLLALEAGMRTTHLHYGRKDPYVLWEDDIKKFAELIVRECADIADSIGEHGYIASEEMLEQFGVK
jgi:hypothetical protein